MTLFLSNFIQTLDLSQFIFRFFFYFFINGFFILVPLQCFIPLYLIITRLKCFNQFLINLKFCERSKQELKEVHALIFEIFEIIEHVSQTFGLQLLITSIGIWLYGSFTIFTVFETVFIKNFATSILRLP